jgi:hypothetical protein
MIQGYPEIPSVLPGNTLILHVSTDQPQFRVDFYRKGENLDFVGSSDWMIGYAFSVGRPDEDWGWLGYEFPIPDDWSSGAYIAMFFEGDDDGNEISAPDIATADGRDAKALFVVRSAEPGQSTCILYKLPLFTYHAYNEAPEHGSLYTGATKVSLRRPGGGTGGNPWDSFIGDFYDTTSPRQTFAHWDVPFISWLEGNGYVVDYCTDLDIHENSNNFLASYNLLLSVGHDEYWSAEMRQHVENFIQNGGNVAFFSGNTCWWQVHVKDDNTAISCDKSIHENDRAPFDQWYRFNPENKLTGVSYRNAGGRWDGEREAVGYTVQHSDHWIYTGTGLSDGDIFGDTEHLVGYECDGALSVESSQGFKEPTGADGTPLNFVILGIGKLTSGWEDLPGGDSTATIGLYTNNGIAFTAATTDWARVLSSGDEPNVECITRNVLDHLKSRGVRIIGPLPTLCNRYVAVEGQTAKFRVNTAGLPNQGNLHYEWIISNGNGVSLDQPIFKATMPSPPLPVTVTVTITDGADCLAFGTLTFIPLSHEEFLRTELFCQLLNLAISAEGSRKAVEGTKEGNRLFVDPLWDPIRNALQSPFDTSELHKIIQNGQRLVELAGNLIEIQQSRFV